MIKSIIPLLILLPCLTSCNSSTPTSSTTFTVALPGPVTEWDWRLSRDSNSMAVMDSLAPRLLAYDKNGNAKVQLGPGLVVSQKYLKSNTSWTWSLTLQGDRTWSDGVPFTAGQLKDSLERLQSEDLAASPCHQQARDIDSIKVVNDQKLELHLKRDLPLFDHELSRLCFSPVRGDLLQKHGAQWTDPVNFVGLGDFLPDAKTHQSQVVLRRFRGGKKFFEKLVYNVLTDPGTALNLYEKNKLDFVTLISEGDRLRARKMSGYFEHPIHMSTFLVLNPNKPPFDSLKHRMSFAASIDASRLVSVLGGARTESPHWIPPSLMKDVGVGMNSYEKWEITSTAEPLLPVELVVHNSPLQKTLAENIQFQSKARWKVHVVIQDWAGYLKTINSNPTSVFRMAWAAFILHPSDFYQIWSTGHTLNRIQFSDTEYDSLSEQLAATTTPEKMGPLMERMSRILIREKVVIVPLFAESRTQLLRSDVKGISILPFHIYDFSNAYRLNP